MSGVLDSIVRKKLVESPETISTDFTTTFVDVSGVEGSYSVELTYSNGDGAVDMVFFLEVSVSGQDATYVPIEESEFTITDDSGVAIWEVTGVGVNFLRVGVTVNAGQLSIDTVEFSGNRRH